MIGEKNEFLTHGAYLALSLALNLGAFYSVDHALSSKSFQGTAHRVGMMKTPMFGAKRPERLEFEFVEAPPVKLPRKPLKSNKISSHDAIAQSRVKNTAGPTTAPAVKMQGRAEQLSQLQGQPNTPPSPRVEPKQAAPPEKPVPAPNGISLSPKPLSQAKPETVPASPERKAAPAENAGRDKITTVETSRLKSGSAPMTGVTSFEATGSGMGVYMKNLKEKIWLSWFPYLAFRYPGGFQSADAVVRFTLDPKGNVKTVDIAESDGSFLFATFCVESVRRAANFGEVPKDILAILGKDELEIKFAFHYH